MYKNARLVHAAMSAYNLLVLEDNTLVVIDVAQSVNTDHKFSTHFLRKDCKKVSEFFNKFPGVHTLHIRTLYEFVSNKDLSRDGTPDLTYDLDNEVKKLKVEAETCGGLSFGRY